MEPDSLINKSFNPDYFLESFSCYRPDFNENSRKTRPFIAFCFRLVILPILIR